MCFSNNYIPSSLPGDNESGKTTLIAKLQGIEEPKKGIGLEYYYLNVKDEYRDGIFDHILSITLVLALTQ